MGKYVASEIDSDAINVSCIQHKDIMHVGDIRKITKKQVCLVDVCMRLVIGSVCMYGGLALILINMADP